MNVGDKVMVANGFHAFAGVTGIIDRISKDEDGYAMVFVDLTNGHKVMVDPEDLIVRAGR